MARIKEFHQRVREAEPKKHYNRFRSIFNAEMQETEVLTTRYTYEAALRKSHIEQGQDLAGKAIDIHVYDRFFRMVYFDQASGRFFRAEKVADGDIRDKSQKVNWQTVLAPIDGPIWDCHESQSESEGLPVVTIQCIDGYPMQATTDNGPIWDCMQDVSDLAHMLGLDKKKRKSPRK